MDEHISGYSLFSYHMCVATNSNVLVTSRLELLKGKEKV